MKVAGVGLVLLGGSVSCRHVELPKGPSAGNAEAAVAFSGDPATNVMIVPASAAPVPANRTKASAVVVAPNATPFPDYDKRVAQSVYDRWLLLLKGEPELPPWGEMVVEFNLTAEGYVFGWRTASVDMPPRVQDLCKRAILQLAPFPKWPAEMRRTVGSDVRAVRFIFHLNAKLNTP